MNADTYRDAFLKFLSEGMNYRKAMECFDPVELRAAMNADIESRSFRFANADDEPNNLFDLVVRGQFEKRNSIDSADGQQCLALWQAGWTSENANPTSPGFWGQTQLMSLYWRAPSRRPGKLGRRYLSTNQAHNAMLKSQKP